MGTFALLAATLLSTANVFAGENYLDYANSIGQVKNGDTINRVVEATSDGGYVVGGQTVACMRQELLMVRIERDPNMTFESLDDDDDLDAEPEIEYVSIEECLEYFENQHSSKGVAALWSTDFSCAGDIATLPEVSSLSDDDEKEYEYWVECVDYIAKFKKDGTREWLTPVEGDRTPLAVGESPNDFRLFVEGGDMYTVSKSGDNASMISVAVPSNEHLRASKIDRDGSLYVSYGDFLCKYGVDGVQIICIPAEDDIDKAYWNDAAGFIVMNGDIYMYYSYYGENEEWGVVKISKDLLTVTKLISTTGNDDVEYYVISGDAEGNVLVMKEYQDTIEATADDDEEEAAVLLSLNSDGEILAEKSINDIEVRSLFFGDAMFMPGYVLYDKVSKSIIKFNKYLEVELKHDLSDGEEIAGSVVLDDGSIILVGGSTSSNSNYNVAGNMNGIQIRLDAAGVDDDEPVIDGGNVVNPSTIDNIRCYAGAGLVVIAGAALLKNKVLFRR